MTWTVDDPDSSEHTTSVLVSDDGGTTWRPLASRITGTSITLPLPADIGGPSVRIRVVVSDGVRIGQADSPTFDAEPAGAPGEERLVFESSSEFSFDYDGVRLTTSRPDGSDVRLVPLPSTPIPTPAIPGFSPAGQIPAFHVDPQWSPDGSRLYFVSNMLTPGQTALDPNDSVHVWSSLPDGSDLRLESKPKSDTSFWSDPASVADLIPGGRCPAVSPDGNHLSFPSGAYLFVADAAAGGGWTNARLLNTDRAHQYPAALLDGTGYPAPLDSSVEMTVSRFVCPTWSPDSTRLAAQVDLFYRGAGIAGAPTYFGPGETGAVAVFPIDGSGPTVVSDPGPLVVVQGNAQVTNNYRSVAWDTDGAAVRDAPP